MKHLITLLLLGTCCEGMTNGRPAAVTQNVSSHAFEETTIATRTNGCRLVTRRYLGENKVLRGTWRQELFFGALPLLLVERKPVSKMLATTVLPFSPTNRIVQFDFDFDGHVDSYVILNGEKLTDVLVALAGGRLRHATPDEYEARRKAFDGRERNREPEKNSRLNEMTPPQHVLQHQ